MGPTKFRISTEFRGSFRGILQLPSQVNSSWETSFLSCKCVLLIYVWNKSEIRGSCMSLGRNASIPCTSMYQGNKGKVASTALAWRLETSAFRKGWIWNGIGLCVLQLPYPDEDFSVSQVWGSEYWSPGLSPHLPGTHEIKDDFTEQRQKGRSLIKFGTFSLACIFLVELDWEIWGCRWSETWLDTAHWWGNWQSVKEDSSTQC